MQAIIVAIHGILTGQTHASWPDKLDGWLFRRDPQVKVLKKEYAAGPFPRLNCWLKNPRLAEAAAEEILLLLGSPADPSMAPIGNNHGQSFPPIWLIAHSNGAHIALLLTNKLIARGCWIGGLILTGAACEADIARNGILARLRSGQIGMAIACCSAEDHVLPWYKSETSLTIPATESCPNLLERTVRRMWSWLAWPYGSLGRTGWLFGGKALSHEDWPASLEPFRGRLVTRWQPGGHSSYFSSENIEHTFEQLYADLNQPVRSRP
jgi:hypothetical protein